MKLLFPFKADTSTFGNSVEFKTKQLTWGW